MLQSSGCGFGRFKEKVALELVFKEEIFCGGNGHLEVVPQNEKSAEIV